MRGGGGGGKEGIHIVLARAIKQAHATKASERVQKGLEVRVERGNKKIILWRALITAEDIAARNLVGWSTRR